MGRRLTDREIEVACSALLDQKRRVGVREVRSYLRAQHGSSGRNARVLAILKRIETQMGPPPPPGGTDGESVGDLRERLKVAEARAARSEDIERHHQIYWARRYAEKADELERKYAVPPKSVPSDQYLRLYQRAYDLERRLSQYEEIKDWQSVVPNPASPKPPP